MKTFLIVLFFTIVGGICIGFYVKTDNDSLGDLIIGLSLMGGFFILMPSFIYHRWKNKSVKDYMLTKENIEKMQDYQKEKKI